MPNQALLGYEPRDFYHHDNKVVSASTDAKLSQPDSIESQIRLRLHAKEAIPHAVIEHRTTEAANTKPQQYSPETLKQIEEPAAPERARFRPASLTRKPRPRPLFQRLPSRRPTIGKSPSAGLPGWTTTLRSGGKPRPWASGAT